MNITPEQFKLRIQEARDIFTDKELASKFSCSVPTLSRWASGKSCAVTGLRKRRKRIFDILDKMLNEVMNADISNEQFRTAIRLVIHNPTYQTKLVIPYLKLFNLKLRDLNKWRDGILPDACAKPLVYKMTTTFLERNGVPLLGLSFFDK